MSRGLNIALTPGKKRLVIVGAGFAGLKLARKLSGHDLQIVLLDMNNFHQFQPLLYQVSTAGLEPSAIAFPLRKIFQKKFDFHFRTAFAKRVNPEKNELETSIGPITYDYLVIATGCDTNYFGKDDLRNKTMALKSISEAIYARNVILNNWEMALNEDNRTDLEMDLSVAIVGAGPTGVELAGTLAEMKKHVLPKDYPEVDFREMKIYLIEASDRILRSMSPKASAYAKRELEKLGVNCVMNAMVLSYENDKIHFDKREAIPVRNVLWVAGVKANSMAGLPPEVYSKTNRVLVNEYNQVSMYPNIFVLGDTAEISADKYPNGHPQVAPAAIQQARNLAKNLRRLIRNKPLKPFNYVDKGALATIGRNRAIFQVGRYTLTGFFAWVIWLFVHLMSIVGAKNRLFIFLDWALNYFTRDPSLRILIKPKQMAEKGDRESNKT